MLIIPISHDNFDLITAVNDGITPHLHDDLGRDIPNDAPAWLVMKSGEVNRIMGEKEMNKLLCVEHVKLQQLMVYYIS